VDQGYGGVDVVTEVTKGICGPAESAGVIASIAKSLSASDRLVSGTRMAVLGGFPTFAPRLSDDEVAPIAAVRRTSGTDRADPSAGRPDR
jgi:hypothetical protein